jgi:alginate O-acetyltransferase complex protein AlgI
MLFHSLEYAIFLVAVFLVYWAIARLKLLRLVFLLLGSYFFYACANPWFLLLIIASSCTDYLAGHAMARADSRGQPSRKQLYLALSLLVNLGLLGVFKYTNFFYGSVVGLVNMLGGSMAFEPLPIMLPVGISFYTFQSMGYSIDLYRGRLELERSFIRFFLFVGFFPQLVAGPIVRAADFLPQLLQKAFVSRDQVGRALFLIGIGLLKKVVVADYIAINLVDRVFDAPARYTSLELLVGLFGYTMQVYMDFSAYSDIAIGSALLLGFHLPDNFDRPYLATSVTDFWRRWHLTLGAWLRDYLYFPLGGSRGTDLQTYRNLFITFLLIGLWHGADWTFVLYGCFHALGMCVNRYIRVNIRQRQQPTLTPWGRVWRILLTLSFVALARIFFRSQTFSQAWAVISVLLAGTAGFSLMTPLLWLLLVGSYIIHWTPRRLVDWQIERFERCPAPVQGAAFAMVVLFVMRRASSEAVPFMYFRF